MVDPIGPKPARPSDRVVAPVLRAVPTPPASQREPQDDAPTHVKALAQELAARPPVDADRVARLRRAVAAGEYGIEPGAIADRLIALKHAWVPNDEA